MTDVLTPEMSQAQREEQAQRKVERFVERFEPAYYELVCHAALPLVLTPELVSYLRNEFLPGLPWMAEVDLLLSDLCSQVGYELYAMDMDVRAYALKTRSETFGVARMKEVANLLISYVGYLAKNHSQMSPRDLETQQWAAMVYLGADEKQQVVDEIAERFRACSAGGLQMGAELLSPAEMTRLAEITQTFREQLAEYPELLDYAALVSDVQLRNVVITEDRVEKVYDVGGRQLRLPDGVRQRLREGDRIQTTVVPLAGQKDVEIADAKNAGSSVMLPSPTQPDSVLPIEFPPLQVLEFAKGELIDRAVNEGSDLSETFPLPLKTANFQVATISLLQQSLEVFEFQTAKIAIELTGLFRRPQWVVKKSRAQGRRFSEMLSEDLTLEMIAIPGASFLMGSPVIEPQRHPSESPQHEVTVPDFLMGRYPITQAQWQCVVKLPQINRELNLYPSRFKGNNLPVERVSWYEAVEFCDRLSNYTDRLYRLPTEAEWEYACRAGTTTPFYFGSMILTEVANYNGNYVYDSGQKGEYRETTTSPNQLDIANAFGLSDMHGNVWEWCHDHWHESYRDAPTDSTAWLTDDEEARRVLRGGSWDFNPGFCRSAFRTHFLPAAADLCFGFRVSCSASGASVFQPVRR